MLPWYPVNLSTHAFYAICRCVDHAEIKPASVQLTDRISEDKKIF